ncbi:MAG: hypothetical protein PVJ39_17200, partial [Gammaproteobacteria bacterium]
MMDEQRQSIFLKQLLAIGLLAGFLQHAAADPLNLATTALETVNNVEPNIMILHDDSGSMDWGVLTNENQEGAFHLDVYRYYYTHPDPGASGSPPALNDDSYVVPTEEFLKAQGLPDPQGGVWRAWNHNYNKIYYNPNVTYTPWIGVDTSNTDFADSPPAAAWYDPLHPGNGALDLTTALDYDTDCTLSDCLLIPALAIP